MTGVIVVLKPPGMTSHDVVARIRRWVYKTRVGHTGTLDPGATGVLPICIGQATRLTQYLLDADKEYRAEVMFNAVSTTEDWTGTVISSDSPVTINREQIEAALSGFEGRIEQVPPMLSAIRHHGVRLYDLHRQGKVVDRQARPVTIYGVDIVKYWPGNRPRALFDITCSRGTYIRTLAVDLGKALGVDAMLNFLVRTRVGPFTLENALTLEELDQAQQEERLEDHILPPRTALSGFRSISVDWPWAIRIRNGRQPQRDISSACPDTVRDGEKMMVIDPDGELTAVLQAEVDDQGISLKLLQVFDGKRENGGR